MIFLFALNDRADDVGLPAPFHLLAHKGPHFARALGRHATGRDGGAAGRQLVQDACFQIAVHRQGERAGNGRRGHDQDVGFGGDARGTRLAHQPVALLHAETVLLVHDDQAKVLEVHLLFHEGMRADRQVGFAANDAAARLTLGTLIQRAGEQTDAVEPSPGRGHGLCEQFARG